MTRVRAALVLWACLAQVCLPVLHAATMRGPAAGMAGWCGDAAMAAAAYAALPDELRAALDEHGSTADHGIDCAKLCATASTPPLPPVPAPTLALRVAGRVPEAPSAPAPRTRTQTPKPPAQGPPASA